MLCLHRHPLAAAPVLLALALGARAPGLALRLMSDRTSPRPIPREAAKTREPSSPVSLERKLGYHPLAVLVRWQCLLLEEIRPVLVAREEVPGLVVDPEQAARCPAPEQAQPRAALDWGLIPMRAVEFRPRQDRVELEAQLPEHLQCAASTSAEAAA